MDSNQSNIEQYYNEVRDQYDGVTLEQFKEICKAPFKLVKEVMSLGILRDIRLQYFGVFKVAPSRIKHSRKSLEANYIKGVISKERYEKRLKVLNSYED